jgi:2-dehydropantoate 2-reductase
MRTLVVGAGATGGFFGARLAQAGRDVTFLVRPGRRSELEASGLRVHGLGRDDVIKPRLVTADGIAGRYDLVLLSVKAAALRAALDDMAPAAGDGTAIVPFLNGMAHLDALTERFGPERVLGGVIYVSTTLGPDGDIVQLAPFASLSLGAQPGGESGLAGAAGAALDGAGFEVSVVPDIVAAMWHKWVFIATLGALTCLMRGTVGEIAAVPGGADLGAAMLAEATAVSAAAGYPVPADSLAAATARMTAAGSSLASSMYRDLSDGLPVEAEQILGDLTGRARGLGVPVPLLDLATMNLRVYQHRRDSSPTPGAASAY